MCYSGPCCGEATESTGVGQDDVGSHGLNQSVASLISKVTFRSRGEEDKDTREAVAKAPARGKAEPRSLGASGRLPSFFLCGEETSSSQNEASRRRGKANGSDFRSSHSNVVLFLRFGDSRAVSRKLQVLMKPSRANLTILAVAARH